ncbi:MAG: sulfatase [Erysipelotrichaceae bacterium]
MNIVYINTHDTGRMISPYGENIPTPSLYDLATDGTLFTQAFACGPTCSPSRSSLLTGTYPHQNGMLGLAQRGFELVNPKMHLANHLKVNGFQTAISGIQHEVGWYLDLDVDKVKELGYENVLTTDSSLYKKEDLHLWDRENVKTAIEWIQSMDTDKPFFLSYGMHSTHRPYPIEVAENINEDYVSSKFGSNEILRHDQAQFMTTAQYADQNIKLLIEAIKEKGLYDETIIIFTTDHGVALPYHKCNLSDTGIGVSLIIRHPDYSRGIILDQLVSQIDIFPTLCELVNIEKPSYLEGKSFATLFEDNKRQINNEIFAELNFHTSYEPVRCVRTSRYKYVKYFDGYNHLNLSNVDDSKVKEYLLNHNLSDKTKQMEALYDCVYDQFEKDNLINEPSLQHIVDELRGKLNLHLKTTSDPILQGELKILKKYKVNKRNCIQASSNNPDDYEVSDIVE